MRYHGPPTRKGIQMEDVIETLYGEPFADPLLDVVSEQHSIRRILIGLGFEIEDNKFYFVDKLSKRIIYFNVEYVNTFVELYELISKIRRDPGLPSEAVALCDVVETKVKKLERQWMLGRVSQWQPGNPLFLQ
jgi:hypothetical protein